VVQARQSYTSSDLGSAQQDAVFRIREMQSRARQSGGSPNPAFRNWSTNPNIRRQASAPGRQEETRPPPPPPINTPQPEPESQQHRQTGAPPGGNRRAGQSQNNQRARRQTPPSAHRADHTSAPQQESNPADQKDTTLLQDILSGVGLDDDRVLILGLVLILINSKADATLILALLYLLL